MRRIGVVALTAALAAGVALGGAGAGNAARNSSSALPAAVAKQGIAAFKKAGCAGCHTLAAVNAQGTRGPNLDGLYFPVTDIIRQVTNGGGYMPAFKGILTKAQISAVARWVDSVRLVKAPGTASTTTAKTTKPKAKTPKATTTAAATATITPAEKAAGLAAFRKAGCGGCHTLAATNSQGTRGPNLDGLYFPLADIIRQVTNGGGYMPSFKGILTSAQIQAVAKYVDAVRKVKSP